MSRIGRGWQMTKKSWSVVKADRSLLGFTVIGAVVGMVCLLLLGGAGAVLAAATGTPWVAIPFIIVAAYLVVAVGIFCSVALAACATRALEGQPTTIGQGLTAARSRWGVILQWAGVQLVIGALISVLQSILRERVGPIVGALIGGLADFAWTVATFFVIPTIALEGLGPIQSLKRSTQVIRSRWGEGLTGTAAIGVITFLLGFLPGGLLIVIGVALIQNALVAAILGVVLIVAGAVVIVVTAVLQATISTVFRVALYRFATQDAVLGPFDRAELEHAFAPRRSGIA